MSSRNGDTEKNLVSDFSKGKVRAFDELYSMYSQRLYSFAMMLLKNKEDARDVVQETFLKIWQKREDITGDKSFKSYLFTISYNITIDLLRKRLNDSRYVEFLKQRFHFEPKNAENLADFHLLDFQVREMIDRLPPRRKEIFILSREKNLSHKEIATNLNITVKTVETQLRLAMRFLKAGLSDRNLQLSLFLVLFL